MKPYFEDDLTTIYHGDCREFSAELGGGDVVVTDPPYGTAYQHGVRRGGRAMGHDGQSIAGDDEPFDPSTLLALGLPTIMWGANHYADRLPPSRGWLVWDKRDGRPSNDQSDCELAWSSHLTTARLFSRYWSGSVRTGREQQQGRLHVNQKPVELMHWCLGMMPEGVVLDPFMGSGSTLVAARELGRRSIGVEVDEAHCEAAAKRCAQGLLAL